MASIKKLLHVIDNLAIGGAQTHLISIVEQALEQRPEMEHTVLSLFGDGPAGRRLERLGVEVRTIDLSSYFGNGGLEVVRQLVVGGGMLAVMRQLREIIRESGPDIVEAHLTYSRLIALPAAALAGVPRRVGFEHGDIYLDSTPFRLANFAGQFFADRILVCSNALGHWNQRTHGIFPSKLEVLHNCVDLSRFSPAEGPPTMDFGLPSSSTKFCAIGTLGNGVNKRMDVCIRAIDHSVAAGADVSLVICGDGPQRPRLERLAVDLDLTDRIAFLGLRDDVPDVLRSCDAFCHAAPFEPFGIVALEAMATALPVIVPDTGGIGEAVDDGVTGYIYPVLAAEQLAEKITLLAETPQLRDTLGRQARRDVEQRFSLEAYGQRLFSLYAEL